MSEKPQVTLPPPHILAYEQGVLNGLKMVVISTQDSMEMMRKTKPYLDFSGADWKELQELREKAVAEKQGNKDT